MESVTTVPQTLDHMKEVINLSGKVIPVIDLRMKFSMQEETHTQETCSSSQWNLSRNHR